MVAQKKADSCKEGHEPQIQRLIPGQLYVCIIYYHCDTHEMIVIKITFSHFYTFQYYHIYLKKKTSLMNYVVTDMEMPALSKSILFL